MKKFKLIVRILFIVILAILIIRNFHSNTAVKGLNLQGTIYKFLQDEQSRRDVFSTAVDLNQGRTENTCVYFVSEVLRRNGIEVPKYICNTSQLISFLKKQVWKKVNDYKKLEVGDICFTTDAFDNKKGIPTHTYIFMGWVKKDSYDYAYICDNQAKHYQDKLYHIRNLAVKDEVEGNTKEAFSFFMKK